MDLQYFLYNAMFEKASGDGEPDEKVFNKWKQSVNMNASELQSFMNSKEGKEAGLSSDEAKENGIHSGRQSAKWILKMLPNSTSYEKAKDKWSSEMWYWARRQNSFIARMRGNDGPLFDDKGNKTRKHTSLLIWGHNPKK